MSSLENLQRVNYSNEMIMTLIKLYKFHGKEFYYTNVLKNDASYFLKNVIERETHFLTQIFKLNVTEHRLRLIILKDSEPKTNDEKIARNLKRVISICCENISDFELTANQVSSLGELLYKDVKKIQFTTNKKPAVHQVLEQQEYKTKRDELDNLFDTFRRLLIEDQHEITILISNFYIDFINIKPFKEHNEEIGFLLIYALLFKNGFTQFKITSFYEIIFSKLEEFENSVIEANYHWESGFSKIERLNNLIVSTLLDNYSKIEKIIADYEFDAKLNKSDNIENTISKAPQIFTKEDIRSKHPTVSDSTITRTLNRLKEEGKLKSLGTGRSAKWHKINMDNQEFQIDAQMNIFDLSSEE